MAPQYVQPTAPQGLAVQFKLPGIALVQMRGEHDLSGKQALTEALASASDQLNVLVDLSECTFMDSSVLGVLIPAGQDIKQRGGRLELVIPPEATTAHRVAKITRLAEFLRIHETRAAGFASFEAGA
jgi:anti-sigma B factor antagonist